MIETSESTPPEKIVVAGVKKPLRYSINWITRSVFGVLLAGLATAALYKGGFYFAALVALLIIAAAREWHRMITQREFTREFLVTSLTLVTAIFLVAMNPDSVWPWVLTGFGALTSFTLASIRKRLAFWEAGGTLYLGIPALATITLRLLPDDGFRLLLALFIAIWATDTGALIFGNLIGGPKLWPALSPNKTWAGLFGGIVLAAIAGGLTFVIMQLSIGRGVVFAALVGVAAHMGDLFESWIKRTFRIKNSGGLIPGHGGVLDRLDSTLLAAPALAIVVLVAGFNPMVRP